MSIPWAVVALRRGAWVWAAWGKFLAAGGVATVVFAVAYWVAWRIAVPWLLALLAGWSRFQLGRDAYGWIQQLGAFGIAVGCAGFAAKTVLIRMRQQARTAVSGGGF